ncbi:hypothetical protein BGZ93_007747 [Podila epicladia]|nr:hypothetical protein BGZ93_007747 [Podila epicladia]
MVNINKMPKIRLDIVKTLMLMIAINQSSVFVPATCTIVFAEFMIGITADINVSKLGVFFESGSSITTSLLAIMIKKSLEYEGGELRAFNQLLVGIALTGVLEILVNVVGVLQISHTSPTTHMVSGAVRGQALLGYFEFHELIAGGRLAGTVMILGGSMIYTVAMNIEMRALEASIIPVTQQDVRNKENMS